MLYWVVLSSKPFEPGLFTQAVLNHCKLSPLQTDHHRCSCDKHHTLQVLPPRSWLHTWSAKGTHYWGGWTCSSLPAGKDAGVADQEHSCCSRYSGMASTVGHYTAVPHQPATLRHLQAAPAQGGARWRSARRGACRLQPAASRQGPHRAPSWGERPWAPRCGRCRSPAGR